MPPLAIPDPREGGWDVRSSARASKHGGRTPTIDPIPMRHSGIVPLVHNAEVKDEDEDTHLNLMRPIRERDQGEVRRRSGTGSYDVSELRAERANAAAAGSKRPKWIAATAAALLVGGAAAAIAMGMSGGDDPAKDNKAHSQTPAGSTTSSVSSPPGTTTRSTAVGLSFQPPHELPPVPVSIQGAPRTAVFNDASGTATLFVFVTGTDDTVWYLPGENSHSWLPLHGLKTGTEPAVVATSAGRLELFAVRSDGVVHQRSYTAGGWSAKWVAIGTGKVHGAPGALANPDGSVVVAAVGSGKTLMTATGTPSGASGAFSFGEWQAVSTVGDLGSGVALTPSPSTSGYTAYVPRASDDGIMAIAYANKSWGTPVQTPLSGLPTAATSGDGTSYVFVRSVGGAVKAMNGNGQAGAGGLQSVLPPGATEMPDGRLAVVTAASSTKLRVSYSG